MQIKELEIEVGPAAVRSLEPQGLADHGRGIRAGAHAARARGDARCRRHGGALPRTADRRARCRHGQHREVLRAAHAGAASATSIRASRSACRSATTANEVVALMREGSVELAIMGRPPKELANARRAVRDAPARAGDIDRAPVRARRESAGERTAGRRFHRARARLGHARRARRVHGGAPDEPAGSDADVEQRGDQAGGDGRHGRRAAVAAHHRTGTRSQADRHPGDARGCR